MLRFFWVEILNIKMDHRSTGTSLLSVIVSMALGMIVLGGAVGWYQIIKKQYTIQKGMQEASTAAKIVFQFLSRDLQASGYKGLRSRDPTFKIQKHMIPRSYNGMSHAILYPIDGRLVFGFLENAHPRCAEGREVLLVYDVPRKRATLSKDDTNSDGRIQTLGVSGIRKGALVLIADCLQGDLLVADDVRENLIFYQHIGGANSLGPLTKHYRHQDNTEVVELQHIMYYLAPHDSEKPIYGFYRENILLPGSEQELVRNIVGFQITYGIWNRDTKTIVYKRAAEVESQGLGSDWANVVSVHIDISVLNLGTGEEHPFQTEIALRNTPLKP